MFLIGPTCASDSVRNKCLRDISKIKIKIRMTPLP